jgi:redox-sensitive bicupin YhaK (pirin superfamily)
MLDRRPFETLGQFRNDWLQARYHFSFADYQDPSRLGLGPLRVWNDDTIAAGGGFDMHGHRDMEIITYVREGAIWHRDHLGNEGRTDAGDVQVMSAGKGILHAEYNLGETPAKIFQIWIEPREKRGKPHWQTRAFPDRGQAATLVPLASGRPEFTGALPIDQDATIFGAYLPAQATIAHDIAPGRRAYLAVSRGRISVNGLEVKAGDGLAVSELPRLVIVADIESELVLADLP